MDEPGEVKLFPPTLNRICYGWVSVISSTELNRNQICNLLEKLILLASSDVHSHYPSGVVKKKIYIITWSVKIRHYEKLSASICQFKTWEDICRVIRNNNFWPIDSQIARYPGYTTIFIIF